MQISERDWKIFRKKIPNWQECYMERLVAEYIALLQTDKSASAKFWELEKRIKNDKRKKGVLIRLSKQNVPFDLVCLIKDGVISFKDIEEFSSDLQETVRFLAEI